MAEIGSLSSLQIRFQVPGLVLFCEGTSKFEISERGVGVVGCMEGVLHGISRW